MLKLLVESDKAVAPPILKKTGLRTDEISTPSSVTILSCMFCEDQIDTKNVCSFEGWSKDFQGKSYVHSKLELSR